MTGSRLRHKLARRSTPNDPVFLQITDRFVANTEFREYFRAVLPYPGRRAGCLLGLTVYIDGAVDRTAAAIVKIRQHTGRFRLRIITVICSLGDTPASDAILGEMLVPMVPIPCLECRAQQAREIPVMQMPLLDAGEARIIKPFLMTSGACELGPCSLLGLGEYGEYKPTIVPAAVDLREGAEVIPVHPDAHIRAVQCRLNH